MNEQQFFPTLFWDSFLNVDSTTIGKKCLELKTSNYPNVLISNRGGWQSTPIELNSYPEFKDLYHAILDNVGEIVSKHFTSCRFYLSDCWININEKHDYNTKHCHSSSVLSGVFYVNAPEKSGVIQFSNPSPSQHYPIHDLRQTPFYGAVELIPKTNKLIVFPSWIEHEVFPNESDEPRISIAFNVIIEN